MPPKATSEKSDKTFSADVVTALLYSTGTTSLSMDNYKMMSSLDGKKTASAFQHDFRSVIAMAKKLKERVDNGETFEPVQPATKRGNSTAQTTPKSTPRKRKNAVDFESNVEDTPFKKSKPATTAANGESVTDDNSDDAKDFIKREKLWEEDHV